MFQSRALCPRVSSFLLALCSPRLGKRDLVCMVLVHLFACFVRVSFCQFSLPVVVGDWLRFVIMALPGFFYYYLFFNKTNFETVVYKVFLFCSIYLSLSYLGLK